MTIDPETAEGVRPARFGRDAAITLSTALFSRGSVLLIQVGAARLLGVVPFNVYVTATIVGAVVYLLSDLGLRQAVIVSASGDEALARGAAHALRNVRRRLTVAGAVLGAAAVAGVASINTEHLLAAAIIVVGYSVSSYARYLRSPLRAAARVADEARLEWLERAAALAGAGVGLAAHSLVLVGVGQLVGALLGVIVTARAVGLGSGDSRVQFTRSPVRYGATLSAAVAATMVGARLDYIVLLRMATQVDAAVYAACYTLILASSLLNVALADTAFAHLPGGNASRRPYLILLGLSGAASMLLIGLTGPFIVRSLFGLDHPDLVPLCWLLGLAAAVMAFTSTIGVFGPMEGLEGRMTALSVASALVTVALCLALIPHLGVIGGAVATVASEVTVGVGWWVARNKRVTESVPPHAVLVGPPE